MLWKHNAPKHRRHRRTEGERDGISGSQEERGLNPRTIEQAQEFVAHVQSLHPGRISNVWYGEPDDARCGQTMKVRSAINGRCATADAAASFSAAPASQAMTIDRAALILARSGKSLIRRGAHVASVADVGRVPLHDCDAACRADPRGDGGGGVKLKSGLAPSLSTSPSPLEFVETKASWVVASVALAILGMSFGAAWITTVALKDIASEVGGPRSVPALAGALAWLGSGFGGILMSHIAERIGIALHGHFRFAHDRARPHDFDLGAPWPLWIGHGLFIGLIGLSGINAPLYIDVSRWFDRRRGSALALISSGTYIAGAVWPPIFERRSPMRLAAGHAGIRARRRSSSSCRWRDVF